MRTSAQALHELLTVVAATRDKERTFSDVIVERFGLEGETGMLEAVSRVHKLISRVKGDIEASDIEEKHKAQLKSYLRPLDGLVSLAHFTYSLKQAKASFLQAETINNITHIHLALDGKVNRYDARADFDPLKESLTSTKSEVIKSDLPAALKDKIAERITLIQSAIEHVEIWGLDGVEDAIAKLFGTLAILDTTSLSDKQKDEVRPVLKVLDDAVSILSKARKAAEDGKYLAEKLPAITDGVSQLVGLLG